MNELIVPFAAIKEKVSPNEGYFYDSWSIGENEKFHFSVQQRDTLELHFHIENPTLEIEGFPSNFLNIGIHERTVPIAGSPYFWRAVETQKPAQYCRVDFKDMEDGTSVTEVRIRDLKVNIAINQAGEETWLTTKGDEVGNDARARIQRIVTSADTLINHSMQTTLAHYGIESAA